MSINNINSGQIPPGSNGPAGRVERGDAKQGVTAPKFASDSSGEVGQASETRVETWTRLFGELPDARPEVIAQAQQRLGSGYYSTAEAAERTARSILGQE